MHRTIPHTHQKPLNGNGGEKGCCGASSWRSDHHLGPCCEGDPIRNINTRSHIHVVSSKTHLGDTTVLLTDGGETTGFTVLVDGVADPVDAGITTDGLVLRVDEDDFVVFVGGVLEKIRQQKIQTRSRIKVIRTWLTQ